MIDQFRIVHSTVLEAVFDIKMFRDLAPGFLNAHDKQESVTVKRFVSWPTSFRLRMGKILRA